MLLVFLPSRFIKFATEETVKAEFKTNKQLKESFPNVQLPLERYKEFEEGIRRSTNTVRHSFAVGFGCNRWRLVLRTVFGLYYYRMST
jgi:hypothetical protein